MTDQWPIKSKPFVEPKSQGWFQMGAKLVIDSESFVHGFKNWTESRTLFFKIPGSTWFDRFHQF